MFIDALPVSFYCCSFKAMNCGPSRSLPIDII